LGRSGLLQINEKKCSRQQVIVNVSEDNKTVTVVRAGMNPARVTRGTEEIMIDQDDVALKDGDKLEVLIGLEPVTVQIEEKTCPEPLSSSEEEVAQPAKEQAISGQWAWKDTNSWKEFDVETNQMIEEAYQKGKSNLLLQHGFFQRDTYTIQFAPKDDMKQINNKTKFDRQIRRVTAGPSNNSAKRKYETSDSDGEPEISQPNKKLCLPKPNAFSHLMKSAQSKPVEPPASPVNAFSHLMKSAQSKPAEPPTSPKKKSALKETTKGENEGGWNTSLMDYINNPEKHQEEIYHQTDKVIVIKDKYPKANVHLLVMPKVSIPNYSRLDLSSLTILRKMRAVGIELIEKLTEENETLKFRIGFHAIPSMKQVHMHVISEDFDSPHLKTKRHWNSFTTDFFVPADDFIKRLERFEKIVFEKQTYDAMLKQPLKCWKTGKIFSTIPKLKEYLSVQNNT